VPATAHSYRLFASNSGTHPAQIGGVFAPHLNRPHIPRRPARTPILVIRYHRLLDRADSPADRIE
jgi:hypothetical protein